MDSAKYWRRRLRSLISHTVLTGVVMAPWAAAQERNTPAAGLATLDAFLDGVQSLKADFKQEIYGPDRRLQRTDTGSLVLERPNRFRWTYSMPAELVVVADGKELKIYDVDLAQITVAPFDDSVAGSPAMLLSGDRSIREQFEVVQSYSADGLAWVKLEPLAGTSDFSSVLIGFDGTTPRRLELVDGLNDVTRIELDNLDVNPELADDVFELEAPEGVDVLGD